MEFSRKISRFPIIISRRFYNQEAKASISNAEAASKRNELFEQEKARQKSLIARVEKIEVKYVGQFGDSTLIMNKNMSTPYNCAMHLNELLMKRSVLALVNGNPWDIHRPLEEDCELNLLHFREDDPTHVNKAFWRSCSLILGMVAEKAFKDQFFIELHSWPAVNVRSGSFVYDVDLKLDKWTPTEHELRTLSVLMKKLTSQELVFDRLVVDKSLALKMFEDNRYKFEQIPNICEKYDSTNVTLYRIGEHIDISQGPMVANTSMIGNCAVASVHSLKDRHTLPHLHRFQGVAVPTALPINHFMFDFLKRRAEKFNDLTKMAPKSEEKSLHT